MKPVTSATLLFAISASLALACSTAFAPVACELDGDCPEANVCAKKEGASFCASAASVPLRIGMSAPASGPNQDLGIEMRKGILLAFDAQNASGGIRGRKLELQFLDDSYVPERAEAAARELLDVVVEKGTTARCPSTSTPVVSGQSAVSDSALARGPNAVIALLGNVGTPTMVRSAPIAVETGSLFFGAFTGAAKLLRDATAGPCARYVFNVRASYANEARATLEYYFQTGIPDYRHLISFDQNDSFGQAGYDGLVSAYEAIKGGLGSSERIQRFRYTRDDPSSVLPQIEGTTRYLSSLLGADSAPHSVGIFMTDTYGAAAKFITAIRDWQVAQDAEQMTLKKATRLTLLFSNVSFVGPDTLAARLKSAGTYATPSGSKSYAEGVLVSQVVPNFNDDQSDGVRSYMAHINAAQASPTFTSLEGYLTARVFIAGLAANTGAVTPDALINTFENLPAQSLGFGASAGFSQTSHTYSKSVWGTAITANGSFANRYYWSEGNSIQVYE
jgi:ABC-type branched-subunit amino acid transport system substrate-binding protein